jgi:hypothetical protein
MTEHAPEKIWSGIDIPKTIAGVLAAVSAAVVGSFLGVAGTLIGAALASIVGSVGTEVYHRLVDHGHKKLKSTFVTAPAAVGTPSVAAAEDESPSKPEPTTEPVRTRLGWRHAALVAGALFVLAMGALTTFELIAGKTVANAVGGSSTLSSCTLCGHGDPDPAPSSGVNPATEQTKAPAATTAPADAPSTTEPAGEPAGDPPEPATTEAPAPENQTDAAAEQPDGTE